MHSLSTIKALNEKAVRDARPARAGSAAHTGHAGNSGIQGHSCGPHFPVLSYCVGSSDHRVAEFSGVRRDSFDDLDGHNEDLDRMKRAERVADAVIAARAKDEGCSVWINRDESPDDGFVVGCAGFETRIEEADFSYNAVYADCVEKLEFLHSQGQDTGSAVCIGSWLDDGSFVLDISAHHADFDDAIAWGRANGQKAIYALKECVDIPV